MSRVLVTGGAGMVGAAVVRRLLADPDFEVRVADERPAPQWMREGCEVHTGDLRVPREARAAVYGCSRVIHLAAVGGGGANGGGGKDGGSGAYTLTEAGNALCTAVVGASVGVELERFVYVSCGSVFERAEEFPTPEDYLPRCPVALSAYGFSKLAGEMCCRAAHEERDLRYTICRVFDVYGPWGPNELEDGRTGGSGGLVADLMGQALDGRRPLEIRGSGEQTRTLTHVEDVAEGIVRAMSSGEGVNEDFNISAGRELAVAEIAGIVWEACGESAQTLELESLETVKADVERRWPSVEKAQRLLGWKAGIELEDGLAATAMWLRSHRPITVGR
jgi:UDP-glucose 4-epimerase